jgi:anhydro-N-acetylmuramic acid kinase
MSGSSLDGLDLALVRFTRSVDGWDYSLLDRETKAYSPELKARLLGAFTASVPEILQLDVDLGRLFGEWSKTFIDRQKLKPTLIASHGHTVFHQPGLGYSQQIGHAAHIAAITGLPVAADFRSLDIALGGQGAPLVPVGDRLLFGQHTLCLNLGGIANLSFEKGGKRLAWDLACCNMVFDRLASSLGLDYDDEGKKAASGKVDQPLLDQLNMLSYYQQAPPKSLGREYFEAEVWPILAQSALKVEDKMATYAKHLALQLKAVVESYQLEGSMLVTGGGAFHRHLIRLFRLEQPLAVEVPEPALIEQKEAIIFALLGLLRQLGETNVFHEVTGSRSDHCGGNLYFPPVC